MMSSIVKFSIRYTGVIIGLAVIAVIFGLYQITRSPLNVFPEFSPNQVIIQTESPGLPSDLVESLVTLPIEKNLGGTIGIETIRSQSIPGLSVITIVFNEHTDIFRNRQVISERLASIVSVMPPGIIPKITPLTSAASSVLGIGITSKSKSLTELRTVVDRLIIPHLLSIPGVADVNIFGGKVKQYQVEIQPEKLIQSNISIEQIISAASKSSGVRGAGFIENNNQRIIINTEGQSKSLEDIGKTAVINNKNQIIYLKDLADIREGSLPTISAASINGDEGIYLSVQGQLGSDTYTGNPQDAPFILNGENKMKDFVNSILSGARQSLSTSQQIRNNTGMQMDRNDVPDPNVNLNLSQDTANKSTIEKYDLQVTESLKRINEIMIKLL